jgi:DNA-binding transcriptional regulator GbsR (MarR family)
MATTRQKTDKKTAKAPADPIAAAELSIARRLGVLISRTGFSAEQGQIWTVLLLAPQPMSAAEIGRALGLTPAATKKYLAEMEHWGSARVVHRADADLYSAETNVFAIATRVVREREEPEVDALINELQQAARAIREHGRETTLNRATLDYKVQRLGQVEEIVFVTKIIFDITLAATQLDADRLKKVRDLVKSLAEGVTGVIERFKPSLFKRR